jgi:hypothetical protein
VRNKRACRAGDENSCRDRPVCIGFEWSLGTNDGTGAPKPSDMGASFGVATGGAVTLFIAAPPNASPV